MMKKVLSLLIVLTILSGMSVFGYEQPNYPLKENILLNGGFESGIIHWDTQAILFAQNECVRTGSGAAIVRGRTNVQEQFYQSVSLKAGKIYLVSAWVRLEDEKYNGDKIYINASGTKSISSDFASVKAYAEDWEYVYRTVTVENDTSSRISLANYSDADLNFYLDDVSVCEIDITGFEPTSIELFAAEQMYRSNFIRVLVLKQVKYTLFQHGCDLKTKNIMEIRFI